MDDPGVPLAGFAVDLDRTLVRPGRRPPEAARRALHTARAMGVKVILVSGRTRAALRPFVEELDEVDAVVGENGAVVEAPRGRRPVVLGAGVAGVARRRLRRAPTRAVEYGTVIASVRRADRPWAVERLAGLPVDLVENVDRVMILPKGITKATGVRLALEGLGIGGRPFAAIGDGENDVPMIRAAALGGAVANATAAARSAAAYRCKAPSARGVAEFVRGPLTDWRLRASRRATPDRGGRRLIDGSPGPDPAPR